ncbi:MAG: hypothetical protein R3C49_11815 [Planctomycetaceae bacterium]
MSRWICRSLIVLLIAEFTVPSPLAYGQGGEDLAKGLLKALIESQLDKSRRRNGSPPPPEPGLQGNLRPHGPTQEMQKLRALTATYAQEAATLAAVLQSDAARNFDIRRRLPDVIRLQATATALSTHSAGHHDHAAMIDEFRSLNSQWAELAYDLKHCRGLSPQATAAIARVAAVDAQCSALLGIQDQFDQQALIQSAYTLTTYLRDLTEDIQGLPMSRSQSRQLMQSLASVNQKAEYFAGLVSRGTQYQAVVAEYQELYRNWVSTEAILTDLPGPNIARTIRRIRDSHRTIHDLLRLEMGVDKDTVLHLIHETGEQVSELLRLITLEDLMNLPDKESVPAAADAMSGTIQNIDDLVHRDQPPQAVGEAWVYLDEALKTLQYVLRPLQRGDAVARLNGVAENVEALRQALGIVVQYDSRILLQNVSSLEGLANRLSETLKRWQTHPGNHDRTLVRQADEMEQIFHHIEQAVAANQLNGHLAECDQAIVLWQRIRPILKTCDTDEQEQFQYISSRLTADLIRLRTMLPQ